MVDNPSHTCADSVALAIILGIGFFFFLKSGLFYVYEYVFACMMLKGTGTGVRYGCELPCGCVDWNSGLLKE